MHAPEHDLLRCKESVEALWVRDGMVHANLHAHTNRSDGRYPIQTVAEEAERSRWNIAVTDHNIPPEYPGEWPAGLISGIEITALGRMGEPVHIVVVGTHARIWELFQEHVQLWLHPTRPRSMPTRTSVRHIFEATRDRVIAHYANVEGLSMMTAEEQAEFLGWEEGNTFVEHNAMVSDGQNALAARAAREWGLPLISTGDTHIGMHQYAASGSGIPAHALAAGKGPLVERLMDGLAAGGGAEQILYKPTRLELLQAGVQVVRGNGLVPLLSFFGKIVRRRMGLHPSATEAGIPKRLPGLRRRTMA